MSRIFHLMSLSQESLANAKVSVRQPCWSKTDFDMSRSLILQWIIGRQGVAYRHVMPLVLSLNVSEEVATQIAKNCRWPTHCHLTPPATGTPWISACLIFPETSHWATFLLLIVWIYLHSFSRCSLPNMWTRAKFCENLNLQQFKVIDFGTNGKRMCDFLLVINSNFGHILHCFWDTATYWPKIAYFSHPLLFGGTAPYVPFGISRWN